MKKLTPRGEEDAKSLNQALSYCEGDEEEYQTFKEWRKQLRAHAMTDIGPKRRAFVRNFIIAAQDAGATARLPESQRAPTTRAELKDAMAERIMCGPLPKTPPGITGNQPRFGRRAS